MKFTTNNVILSMTLLAASIAASTNATATVIGNEDGQNLHFATTNSDDLGKPLSSLSKQTKIDTNEYFVVLTDAPLATYDGRNVNYKATNILASKGENATERGKLNTKTLASKRYRSYLANKQSEAKLHAEMRLKRQLNVKLNYSIVMNGFVADLTSSEAVLLQQLDGIKFVEKVGIDQLDTDSGPTFSGADKVWSGGADRQIPGYKGEGIIVAILDSGIASFLEPVEDIYDTENLPPFHPSFADVGADGYDHTNPWGEGVYIGDCADRTLRSGKFIAAQTNWCNDKLIGVVGVGVFGTDIINKSYDDARTETGQDANGHGTHTASTAAGNVVRNVRTETEMDGALTLKFDETFTYEQISGVAPHANIVSFQVCNSLGSCNQSYSIAAIEQAIEVGVDVVNYSISGPATAAWYHASSLAFLGAREAGIHIAASAGNSGASGSYTVRSPANAPWVTAVAANTSDRGFNEKVATLIGGPEDFSDDHFIGKGATSGLPATDVVFAGDVEFDTAEQEFDIVGSCATDSIPAEKIKGKVVICNRGGRDAEGLLSRISKGYAVKQLGAAGMILINTSETRFDTVFNDMHALPALHLQRKPGKKLLEWLEQGEGHQIAINNSVLESDQEYAGIMGDFSSRGPGIFTHDYLLPDISAVGVKVLAAGLGDGMNDIRRPEEVTSDKDFLYMTGTSMSSPHVAGMFALIKGVRPQWSPAEAQSALMLTAGTGLKNYGAFENGEQTFEPAKFHQTGSGLARVDLAIASGLVMHETEKGYLIADPFGDVPGMKVSNPDGEEDNSEDPGDLRDLTREPIADWHGEPSQINVASLSKGECEIQCSWSRTFKATKATSWELSYSYLTEGFEISSDHDGQRIDVAAGDEFTITFFATLEGQLNDEWVNGRVHMTPSDSTIPAVSLPVAVEYVAGHVPESVEVNAHRNKGSVEVEGIVTVGTDDLTIRTSSLTQGQIFTGNVQRAENPTAIYQDVRKPGQPGMVAIPLNIPFLTQRLVIEVLETTSPDLDIFVGEDFNSDGQIQQAELDFVYFWGTEPGSQEVLDYIAPRTGQYWILVHNYGDHYNNSDDEEFDPAALVMDTFKLSVSVVERDDETLNAKAPKSVARGAEVPVTLKWDKEMAADERYYGIMRVATSKQQLANVGTVNISVNRQEDDVKLSVLSHDIETERAGFDITIAKNDSRQDRKYQMSIELVEGTTVESLTQQDKVQGQGTQSAGDAINYELDGNTLTWEYVHVNGAAAQAISLIINYTDVEGLTDVTPAVYSVLDEYEEGEYSVTDEQVIVQGRPIFELKTDEQYVDPGTEMSITAALIDAVIDNPVITYKWVQVEGPSVEFNPHQETINFTIPNNADGKSFLFEMQGSNGERNSNVETIAISVTGEDVGNGGSFAWYLSLLVAFTAYRRNRFTRSAR